MSLTPNHVQAAVDGKRNPLLAPTFRNPGFVWAIPLSIPASGLVLTMVTHISWCEKRMIHSIESTLKWVCPRIRDPQNNGWCVFGCPTQTEETGVPQKKDT